MTLPVAPAAALSRLAALVRRRRAAGRPSLMLGGEGWSAAPLAACEAHTLAELRSPAKADAFLSRLDRTLASRRASGGRGGTGIVLLLDYEALGPLPPRAEPEPSPYAVAIAVDAALRLDPHDPDRLEVVSVPRLDAVALAEGLAAPAELAPAPPARLVARPRTSLPRDAYLRAVDVVRAHIARGDVYQANLSQQFALAYAGDLFETWLEAERASRAPLAAWVEAGGTSVASLSPEVFLLSREPGVVETHPIKGTRSRGASPAEDRAAAAELVRSPKDRAELAMIVDLERNDLSRVCRPGTVEVPEPATLRSFAAVHHLVARVRGQLQAGVRPSELMRATFPGGSISGAPKRRAIEILRELEPVRRGLFTGSLLWFDDDGTLSSSLLIRTLVGDGQRVRLGAGGGVVADSDPEAEWHESNHKARALARALGFDPEEAT